VTFAGSPDRVEARLVPEAGFAFDAYRISGLPRRPGFALVRALGQAVTAPVACLRILERRKPDVVLGGGGYVAGPMVLAAWLRRIPAAITEADAHLGLANRLAAPYARRVFLAYEIAGRDSGKYRVVGRPVPRSHQGVDRDEARRRLGLPPDGPVLGFFGALAGARSLNEFAVRTYGAEGPPVLHLTGSRDYDRLRAAVSRSDYVMLAETEEFGAALAAADLAVSRAGGTVWELAAAGTPAILVPYPHATGGHQTLNAAHFMRGGGALVVLDEELDQAVPPLVDGLLGAPERLAEMRRRMLALARPRAADEIADELVALARG
jgi:UDP-N-acetylglucosamine--N-acetylmuramyl-(pentapeptide) pyrophosphoryl-undecaprenol N-acetylglucosamine transferase